MAMKLSKIESDTRSEFIDKLMSKRQDLTMAVGNFNDAAATNRANVETALTAYNELLKEVQTFIDETASRIEDEIGEKSDKWQEGDAGSAAQDWQSSWADASSEFDPIDIDYPDELEVQFNDHDDLLADLDTEPS